MGILYIDVDGKIGHDMTFVVVYVEQQFLEFVTKPRQSIKSFIGWKLVEKLWALSKYILRNECIAGNQ